MMLVLVVVTFLAPSNVVEEQCVVGLVLLVLVVVVLLPVLVLVRGVAILVDS